MSLQIGHGQLVTLQYNYKHISTNATTVVKTGPTVLRAINVNDAGASANTATVYDGVDATGTVVAVLDTTSANALRGHIYDVKLSVGLTVVTATGTAGDLTVSYE